MKKITVLILLFTCSLLSVKAQFTLNDDKSSMTIDGTSNIHDWTENVGTLAGKLDANFESGKLQNIKLLTVNVPVKSIKSGKSAMDKNTYNALKEAKHPNIVFTLKSATLTGDEIKLSGTLQIAGTTKNVTFTSKYSAGSSAIVIFGKYTLNMTDYNVEPPKALMGTVTTGENVTLEFKLYFTK